MQLPLSVIERDHQYIWHPCSQMKEYETFKPLEVVGAKNCYIHLRDGRKIVDAISSWWCKTLGHNHPRIKNAVIEQINKFEHVLLANTTNETIVNLSEKLAQLTETLTKVFYASDGSSAVEIAMKMSVHARKIQGLQKRNLFLALSNSYHGETAGALSVSNIGKYREPYTPMLFTTHFISSLPYVQGVDDPLWDNCDEQWKIIEKQLAPFSETATALLVEPIIQGAAGMKIYSQDFLKKLRAWTKEHDIHLIADEIMTGIGRTGKMLACEHAGIEADFVCLSKGLTSGWLPLSAVLTSNAIYHLFYDDVESGKAFLHSHTFSGNPLAASAAIATLSLMKEEKICDRAEHVGKIMRENMVDIANSTGKLTNVRSIGAIVAADLCSEDTRAGFAVYQKAIEFGILLRPLGNTIYWLPPLTIEDEVLMQLKHCTEQAIQSALRR